MTSGIYNIINKLNGNVYVGSSKNCEKRFKTHKLQLKNNTHHCIALQRAVDKYGLENFDFVVIKQVKEKDLLLEEQKEIDTYTLSKNCYNTNKFADKPPTHVGEEMYNASITNKQANEIRKEYNENDNANATELSKKYNIKPSVILSVVKNQTYFNPDYVPKDNYKYKPQKIYYGEESVNAKFTNKEVKKIRDEYNEGHITLEQLSKQLNYDHSLLFKLIHNESYHDPNYVPKDSYKKTKTGSLETATKIREEYKNTDTRIKELGEKYGISKITVSDILRNVLWKDENYVYEPKPDNNFGMAKLNREKAREIRELLSSGESIKNICLKFNVHKNTVSAIKNNKAWVEK